MPVVIVLIIAVLLIAGGLGSLLIGTDSVVPDRPLIAGLGGIIAMVGGCVLLGMALVLRELITIRSNLDAARRANSHGSAPLTEVAPVRPVVTPSASPLPPVRDISPLPGLAGAGALAAVAAAVGATAAMSGEDSGGPKAESDRAPAPEADSRPMAAETGVEPVVPAEATLPATSETLTDTAIEPPSALAAGAASVLETPPSRTLNVDAELARESDPFNLQAEFDRLLDEAVAGAGPVEPAGAEPESGSAPLSAASQGEPETELTGEDEPLVKPAEPMSAEDKSQLEDLVRAAIGDAPLDDSADQLPEKPIPVAPPVESLRERIASALEPLDRIDREPEAELAPEPVAVPDHADDRAPADSLWPQPSTGPVITGDMPAESADPVSEVVPAEAAIDSVEIEDAPAAIHEVEEPAAVPHDLAETGPAPAPPQEEAPDAPSRSIVRTFSSGANHYTMYTDGSISADTPSGRFEFTSFNELRAFIDTYKG